MNPTNKNYSFHIIGTQITVRHTGVNNIRELQKAIGGLYGLPTKFGYWSEDLQMRGTRYAVKPDEEFESEEIECESNYMSYETN
jgi:hypothetical protein